MQAVNMGPLSPAFFDLWCTFDEAGKNQVTGYLQNMREKELQQFALSYSIECKSTESTANAAPKYNLSVKVVDSPEVKFDDKFTLKVKKSATIKNRNLTIRFDGSEHKEKSNGGVVGFIRLTTTQSKEEQTIRIQVKNDGTANFSIGQYECRLIKTEYDESVTLVVQQPSMKEEKF
jgi:hypothetical protein